MSEPVRKGGEWRAVSKIDGDILVRNDEEGICSVFGDRKEAMDDARLMVAALELLAACQMVVPYFKAMCVTFPGDNTNHSKLLRAVTAAVDKATKGGE